MLHFKSFQKLKQKSFVIANCYLLNPGRHAVNSDSHFLATILNP